MSGSAEKPYVLDDSDHDDAPRRILARRSYIEISSPSDDELSHSPPPASKTLPLRENPQSDSSSLRPPILEQLPKRTSLRSSSSGSRTPQEQSPKKSPGPGIKVSPRTLNKLVNGTSTTGDEAPALDGGDPARVERDMDEMGGIEKSPTKIKTRSRQDSLDDAGSQESFDRSIGSESPLLIRLKEQRSRSRSRKSTNHQASYTSRPADDAQIDTPEEVKSPGPAAIAKIEHFLVDLDHKMNNDHATAVQWILYDSKKGLENRKPISTEEESPFTSLKSVHIRPGILPPEGAPLVHSESTINKKNRLGRSKSLHYSKPIKSETPRVPKYSHNTTVRRNILTMDDEKLRYIPYMGEAESSKKKNARLLDELKAAYNPKATSSGRESEWGYQIRAYLTEYLEELDLPLTQDILVQYLLDQGDQSSGRNTKDIQTILGQYDEPLEPSKKQLAKAFSEAFQRIHKYTLRETLLPDDRLKEMAEQLKRPIDDRLTKTPPKGQTGLGNVNIDDSTAELNFDRLGTYTTLTCLICGAMSCPTHGDSVRDESAPGYHQYIHQPLVTSYQDILRKQDAQSASKTKPLDFGVEEETPCGPECHLVGSPESFEYDMPSDVFEKIEGMVISLRDKKRRSCTIAYFVERPCWQVHLEIQQMEPRTLDLLPPGRTKQPDWYNNQKKTLKWDWQDLTTAHLHQERCQANPCAHDGPCTKGCPCYDSLLLCESICGCTDDCPRKFTGCGCHSAGQACVSDSCICMQMNRECGPQCSSCGAIPRLDPASRYQDELFATGCQNIHLQRGVTRKLVLGESQLEGVGFGLYLGEPVRKGEFLSEYTGEVISFLEADRRGIIYDRKFLSFLFDLNSEWAIDAARLGNKSRFINHSDNDKDGLNCEAKIVLVNGEHRIKFMALRDIKVGEELLFNYGKKFADKHGLNKKLPKGKEGSKRGVVVGEEALEALDGLTPASRETRGKMTAIRGGHGDGTRRARKTTGASGGCRKAMKTATQRVPQTVVEETSQEDDVFAVPMDDAGEEEEDIRDGRKKRKIVRPARYTR